MRMGYAPLLALLEPARARGFRRLAVIGIPCQVYALRALEQRARLGAALRDRHAVLRQHHDRALPRLPGAAGGRPRTPSPIWNSAPTTMWSCASSMAACRKSRSCCCRFRKLPADFFPLTCRTCVDYTNVLADITVGYMGGQGEQWLLVRNERGEELLALLGDEVRTAAPGSAGKRQGPVKASWPTPSAPPAACRCARMPNWLRPLVGWLMPRIGPRGLEFARARVEMKAVETVLHLRREQPRRMNTCPGPRVALVAPYGLTPLDGERG